MATKLSFKYKDEFENISIKHNTDREMTTIEWYIEKMCDFLVALGFSKSTIQKFIGFDGEVYTIEDWVGSLNEDENSED